MSIDDQNGTNGAEAADNRQSKFRGPEPVTGDPAQTFELTSRRGRSKVSAEVLIEAINAGRERIFVQAGRFTQVLDPN